MISKVVVVGGGTAGWSTAAILSKNQKLSVTVIDPSSIPIIGVGESTIPHIHIAHKAMNFDVFRRQTWLDQVDGTVKLTIEFADFFRVGEKWIHPFFDAGGIDTKTLSGVVSYGYPNPEGVSQKEFIEKHALLASLRTKGFIDSELWYKRSDANIAGAFHVDAKRYADLLRTESLKRAAVVRVDKVVNDVVLSEDGSVDHLLMEDGSQIKGDLYVDCTGFSAMLSRKVGSAWTDKSDRLLVDRAMAAQLPYVNKGLQLRNTTYCHALSSGWVWNVPLQSRVGTGYVFSSSHTSESKAKDEFAQHLSEMYGYKKADISPRVIKFQTGYREQPWTKNVVAIGLSSLFCEPIESTAIATGHILALDLAQTLEKNQDPQEMDVLRFNFKHCDYVKCLLNFVELHYTFTKRDDSSFWRDYRQMGLRSEHREIVDLFRRCVITRENFDEKLRSILGIKSRFFGNGSYACLLLGAGLQRCTQDEVLSLS